MLLVANLASRKWCKKLKNDWNPGKWVLIWEGSGRAVQWIPTWQGLDGFQRSLHPSALGESSLSIGRVKTNLFAPQSYWPTKCISFPINIDQLPKGFPFNCPAFLSRWRMDGTSFANHLLLYSYVQNLFFLKCLIVKRTDMHIWESIVLSLFND